MHTRSVHTWSVSPSHPLRVCPALAVRLLTSPSQPLTLYPLGGTPHLALAAPEVRGFWTCCAPLQPGPGRRTPPKPPHQHSRRTLPEVAAETSQLARPPTRTTAPSTPHGPTPARTTIPGVLRKLKCTQARCLLGIVVDVGQHGGHRIPARPLWD